MATNVTLIKNCLVQEYLTYDGQYVIVHSTLTDAGECSIKLYCAKITNELHALSIVYSRCHADLPDRHHLL